jgi:hypothetical protein
MKTKSLKTEKTALASSVAHEDLRVDDYVSVLNEIVEIPSFLWPDSTPNAEDAIVKVKYQATESGLPLKIKTICLPYVYVKSPYGQSQTLDVRQVQLVRLKKRYSKTIWKDLKKNRKKHRKNI